MVVNRLARAVRVVPGSAGSREYWKVCANRTAKRRIQFSEVFSLEIKIARIGDTIGRRLLLIFLETAHEKCMEDHPEVST